MENWSFKYKYGGKSQHSWLKPKPCLRSTNQGKLLNHHVVAMSARVLDKMHQKGIETAPCMCVDLLVLQCKYLSAG